MARKVEGYSSASQFVRTSIMKGMDYDMIVVTLVRNGFTTANARTLYYTCKGTMREAGVVA
jgi:hypothetical protein